MKKILLLTLCFFAMIVSGFAQTNLKQTSKNKNSLKSKKAVLIASNTQKPDAKTIELRKCHEENLKNTPYTKTLSLSKKERKAMGIPPNKYYETEWELTMNPETGRPTVENIVALRKQLEADRAANRAPGDAADNSWVERGPTNVGGRTRAVMFDPNDTTNETVFAGGVSGGLWKNTNISNPSSVWIRVGIPENLAVSCITVDPNNSNIFYVGTGESYVGGDVNGDGVWKTTDGGVTWIKVFGGITGPTYFESASNFLVNSPTTIAGSYLMVEAPQAFGTFPPITTPITGDIALGNSPTTPTASTVTQGCNPLTNGTSIAGKIAIIRRGVCNFSIKVKNAQDAGAIAVIIMNNVSDAPFSMGGSDALITIPSVMIGQAEGDMLENALLTGNVNITLNPSTGGFTGNLVPGIQHINRIKVRNNDGVSEVYVAAGDTNYGSSGSTTYMGGTTYGLYKTTDGGSNWTEVNLPLTSDGKKYCPNDIEVGADNKVWLSTIDSRIWGNGGGKVFSSTDGITFVEKYNIDVANPSGSASVTVKTSRTEIAVSNTNPNKVYVLADRNSNDGTTSTDLTVIYKTTDDFATSSIIATPVDADTAISSLDFTRGQAFYDLMMEINPLNDENLFVGGIDIFSTSNGGTSWNQKSIWTGGAFQDVHSDQHIAAFAPGASNKMLFGNDGGVFYTNDSGTAITSRNEGFNVTQFYSLGVAPTNVSIGAGTGDNFVAGAQDNGSNMFLNAPSGDSGSVEVQGGDGAFCMFDQDGVDKYRITNYVYNNTIRLYNYATNVTRSINTESQTTPGTVPNGAFIAPMTLDSAKDILYSDYSAPVNGTVAASYRVRRYKNIKSGTFQKALMTNTTLLNTPPTALTVSPYLNASSTSTLLIGTRNGRLLKVTNADAGTTTLGTAAVWSNITGPAFAGSISDVEYGNTENDIYVTFHNYNVASIWYTADGGVTWQNKEGNFPDIPVKCILRNPLNVDEVIIGTELGIWRTETFNTALPIWIQSQNGMQNVKVTDLDLRNDNAVYAATYGRGIFSGVFTANLSSPSFAKTESVKVYPNPSNGIYNLKFDKSAGKVIIQVVDINGRIIYNQVNESSEKTIDLSAFQSGIYVLKVSGNDLNYSEKLIKN